MQDIPGEIYRKVWSADCRNDFSNRLQSSRADRKWFPAGQEQLVQSDGHWLHFRVEEMYRTEIAESVCLW